MNENTTTKGEKMDKERIAIMRKVNLREALAPHAICELLDALEAAQAHIARLEAALVEAEGAWIGTEELAALREVVRLVDEARERYDKRPRGAGGQRMPDEIDDLLCRLYEIGAHPALRTQPTEGGAT